MDTISSGHAAKSTRKTVLIADDVRDNRELLVAMLGAEDCDCLTAEDGPTALAIARERLPDLILCDLMMPGMHGYEVAATLKADPRTSRIPLVLVSAVGDANSRLHGLNSGAVAFIQKPVDYHAFLACVRPLLHPAAHGA